MHRPKLESVCTLMCSGRAIHTDSSRAFGPRWIGRAQQRTPQTAKAMPSRAGGSVACLQSVQVPLQFRFGGPSRQIKLEHLESSFVRLSASPQSDQQARYQRHVDLDRNPVVASRKQMATAQDAFEPAEKQLSFP